MTYNLHLDCFEGPFDLLLHLIEQNDMDIQTVKISAITDQYIAYMEEMQQLDLDIASEFLVMAAKLLYIKARSLLPKPPAELPDEDIDEMDGEEQLRRDLMEYKRIKLVAEMLGERKNIWDKAYTRPNEQALYAEFFAERNPLEGKTLDDLSRAFSRLYKKAQLANLVLSIKKEGISIGKLMDTIVKRLAEEGTVEFECLFEPFHTKYEMIIGFLALLELIKLKTVGANQADNFGKIYIYGINLETHTEAIELA